MTTMTNAANEVLANLADDLLNAYDAEQQRANDLSDAYANRLTPGVYETNGNTYVVKYNKARTNLYAKQLINRGGDRYTWEYVSGAIYAVKKADLVTLARGQELSRLIGACCVCNRTLTDPKSVNAGIGPVCAKYFV